MAGQLWVIEGADGVGKATQTHLLVEKLQNSGLLKKNKVHYYSFPNYESRPWGELIRQHLAGELGEEGMQHPYYASILYTADRGQLASQMNQLLSEGDWIICDRYTSSNAAHQGVKIADIQQRDRFLEWLEDLEYNQFQIPAPSGTVLLHLDTEISQARIEKRRKTASAEEQKLGHKVKAVDIYEQDQTYLSTVTKEYVRLAEKGGWSIIQCNSAKGQLSREEIAALIWKKIKENF